MRNGSIDIDALIDDRPDEGVFRVRREIFNDPQIFDLEMRHIFEATWVYVGLETQVARPHDFITTTIGRQPVIVMRGADGRVGCFINSCRHRGTIVCPLKSGNQKQHVCRYHGWAYDSSGRNIAIPGLRDAQYPTGFEGQDHNLVRVPRLENYRGFLFASLSAEVPPLEEHLGDVKLFLDLMADQAPQGLELVPGEITYTFDANWKFQFENGLDAYHFPSTHGSYMDVIRMRADGGRTEGTTKHVEEEPPGNGGSFSFARGHALMWSNRNAARIVRPLMYDPDIAEEVRSRIGDVKFKWARLHRNLTIYPNLQVIDVHSSQLRVWQPLAPDKTEMVSYCIAPIGENAEARRRRIRQYEDFFNPTGLATPDDNVMYELGQAGYAARDGGWPQGYMRGLGAPRANRSVHADELGITPDGWAYGSAAAGDETLFHAGYREWRRLIKTGLERR